MTESSSDYVSLPYNSYIQSNKKNCCKCKYKCKILHAIYFIFFLLYINYDLIIINSVIQVSYEDEQEQCSGSNVWLYLLMSLLLNHSLFFLTGLPGGINYINLFLTRNRCMQRLTQKRVNNSLNLWIKQ